MHSLGALSTKPTLAWMLRLSTCSLIQLLILVVSNFFAHRLISFSRTAALGTLQASSTMCSSIAAATKPTPPQSHIPLAQAAKVEKQKKRRSRKHSFDLRRGVLINNAVKAHHQRKQERRKQREAAKVAQALEAISAVKVPPSTVVQCPDTSPFLTPPPSPPPQAALFVNPSYNLATSPSNPFSSNAKTTPTCTHPDPFDIMMELVLKHDDGDVIAKASTNSVIVRTYPPSLPSPFLPISTARLKKHRPD